MQTKLILYIIIGILVVAGVAGASLYFTTKQPAEPSPSPVIKPPPEKAPVDETADWKTFESKLGFNFKYPEDKVTLMPTCDFGMMGDAPLTPTPAELCPTLMLYKKGGDYPIGPPPKGEYMFVAFNDNTKGLALKNYIQEWWKLTYSPYQGDLIEGVIAGKEFYTYTYIGKPPHLDYTQKQKWTFINVGSNKFLSIEINFTVANELFPIFEKTFSTIRFAN